MIDYKELFFKLIASLTLCDHMGDVMEDVECALRRAGVEIPEIHDDYAEDVMDYCFKHNITTLYDTSLENEVE